MSGVARQAAGRYPAQEVSAMPSYLVIESHDPFELRDVEEGYRLVADLAARGTAVTLFLV
jgi:hypothetical protein